MKKLNVRYFLRLATDAGHSSSVLAFESSLDGGKAPKRGRNSSQHTGRRKVVPEKQDGT